jgi:hypothetical protein
MNKANYLPYGLNNSVYPNVMNTKRYTEKLKTSNITTNTGILSFDITNLYTNIQGQNEV